MEPRTLLTAITVDSTADRIDPNDGVTTLREAIVQANSDGDHDTINFSSAVFSSPKTIFLGGDALAISQNLTIEGPGARLLEINGSNSSGVFETHFASALGDVTLSGLRIRHASDDAPAILNRYANLTLDSMSIQDNAADGISNPVVSAGVGGEAWGNLQIVSSTIADNAGAGVRLENGNLDVSRSTIAKNLDRGISHEGASGEVEVAHSTIAFNEVDITPNGRIDEQRALGGGIYSVPDATLRNTILVGNIGELEGSERYRFCYTIAGREICQWRTRSVYTATSSNTLGTINSTFSIDSDSGVIDTALKDNGGPTDTFAIVDVSSPAVDRGNSFGSGMDQRGYGRRVDIDSVANANGSDGTDIGAFEYGSFLNVAPSEIALSSSSVAENANANTTVGTLTVSDPNNADGDSQTLRLLDDADGRFAIDGNRLVVTAGAGLNFEDQSSHEIRIRATDAGGLTYEDTFTISVTDVDEPHQLALSSQTVSEATANNAVVAEILVTDEDAGDASAQYLLELVDSADGRFRIVGSDLVVNDSALLDFERATTHTVVISAKNENLIAVEKSFSITVTDANDAPSAVNFTAPSGDVVQRVEISEAIQGSTVVAVLSVVDQDLPNDSHTYQLADDANGRFVLNGRFVRVAENASFSTGERFSITVQARDNAGATVESALNVSVILGRDDLEPNDSFQTAAEISFTAGQITTIDEDAISSASDVDYFKLTLPRSGTIRLDIDAQESDLSSVDTVMQLFNGQQSEIARNDDAADPDTGYRGGDSALERYVDEGGVYYVRVRGIQSSIGAYDLQALVTLDEEITDPYEPNNDLANAALLEPVANQVFTTRAATLAPANDRDVYKLVLDAPATLQLDTDAREQNLSRVDTVIELLNENGNRVERNDDGTDPDSGYRGKDSALERHVEAGTFYISVEGYDSETGAYNLSVLVTPDITSNDPYEDNDAFADAAVLNVMSNTPFTTRGAEIASTTDVDTYAISVAAHTTLQIDIDAQELGLSNLDAIVFLYNSDEGLIGRNDDGVDPQTGFRGLDSILEMQLPAAGDYFIRVVGGENTVGQYKLGVLTTVEVPSNDVGDTIETAREADVSDGRPFEFHSTIGDPTWGSNDVDMYRFTLDNKSIVQLDIDAAERGSALDSVLRLFDANGDEITKNDESADPQTGFQGQDAFIERELRAGMYYVGVSSYRNFTYDPTQAGSGTGNSTGEYVIIVSSREVEPPVAPTPREVPQQVVWINFGGGTFVDNGTPIRIPRIRAAAFGIPDSQREALINATMDEVRNDFVTSGGFSSPNTPLDLPVTIVTERPASGPYSTVFVGGRHPAMPKSLLGVAQSVDRGNRNISDDAAVFSDLIGLVARFEVGGTPSISEAALALANTISHEMGHLFGLSHLDENAADHMMQVGTADPTQTDNERFGAGSLFHTRGSQDSVELLRQNLRLTQDDAGVNNSIDSAIDLILTSGHFTTITEKIDQVDDVDVIAVFAEDGDTLRVDIDAHSIGADIDTRLVLLSADDTQLQAVDNSLNRGTGQVSLDPYLQYTFSTGGLYYVEVSGELLGASDNPSESYQLTASLSPSATENSFEGPTHIAVSRGTTLSNGDTFNFVDSNGDNITVSWAGAGTANVRLNNDAPNGEDISLVTIDGASGTSSLTIASNASASTTVEAISVANSGAVDLLLGSANLTLGLERLMSNGDLGDVTIFGSLGGQLIVNGSIESLDVATVLDTAAGKVSGGIANLNVDGDLSGALDVGGTIGTAQIGNLTSRLSVNSATSITILGDVGAPESNDQHDALLDAGSVGRIDVATSIETLDVRGDLRGTIVSPNGIDDLTIGGRVAGSLQTPRGRVRAAALGAAESALVNGLADSNAQTLSFSLSGRGTFEDGIQFDPIGGGSVDVILRRASGEVVSRGLTGSNRISFAGFQPGGYQIEISGSEPTEYALSFNGNADAGDPEFAALDIDGDGKFSFSTDGIVLLAHALGSTGEALQSFRGPGSDRLGFEMERVVEQLADALDLDGDRGFEFATDGIMLLAHSLGARGETLRGFANAGADRSGERIEARIRDLQVFAPASRMQTPEQSSVTSSSFAASETLPELSAVQSNQDPQPANDPEIWTLTPYLTMQTQIATQTAQPQLPCEHQSTHASDSGMEEQPLDSHSRVTATRSLNGTTDPADIDALFVPTLVSSLMSEL